MMKKYLLLATLLFVASPLLLGQATLADTGGNNVSYSAKATTGAGTLFVVPAKDGQPFSTFGWQTKYTGTPTAITVNLEGSLDGTTFFTLDSSTSTAGEYKSFAGKPALFIRCNISVYTVNGSTATCQFAAGRQ